MNEKNNTQQRDDAIYTDSMIIRDNIMEWGNTMIQLSNICSISTSTFVKENPFPTQSLLLGGVGLITLFVMPPAGIIMLIMFVLWIVIWKKKKDNPDKTMTLNIMMNSGSVFKFVFYDDSFKLRILRVLESIISKGNSVHIGDINIDIKNNKINGNLDFMNVRN